MYEVRNNFSPSHMNEIFELRNERRYNLRQSSQFFLPLVNSVYHGTESLSYLGPKVWDILPNIYKNIDSLHKFKKAIKKWKPENCPCRICKKYNANVGFIWKTKQCLNYFWLPIVYLPWIYVYMCIYICVYIFVCMCICICIYMRVWMCICICACVYVYVHTYLRIYMCVCVYVYGYIYMYIVYMCMYYLNHLAKIYW